MLQNTIDRTLGPLRKAEEMGRYILDAIASGDERWAVHYAIYAYRYADRALELGFIVDRSGR